MTPWYLKILQEFCPHNEATIIVTRTIVTCESYQERCKACGKILCSITDCA